MSTTNYMMTVQNRRHQQNETLMMQMPNKSKRFPSRPKIPVTKCCYLIIVISISAFVMGNTFCPGLLHIKSVKDDCNNESTTTKGSNQTIWMLWYQGWNNSIEIPLRLIFYCTIHSFRYLQNSKQCESES